MLRIYDRIKRCAKQQGIPVYVIEKEAQLSSGSICKWNVVSPSVQSLVKVADVLRVPVSDLIGSDE